MGKQTPSRKHELVRLGSRWYFSGLWKVVKRATENHHESSILRAKAGRSLQLVLILWINMFLLLVLSSVRLDKMIDTVFADFMTISTLIFLVGLCAQSCGDTVTAFVVFGFFCFVSEPWAFDKVSHYSSKNSILVQVAKLGAFETCRKRCPVRCKIRACDRAKTLNRPQRKSWLPFRLGMSDQTS